MMLTQLVYETLDRRNLVRSGDRVLVAFSGGPDSTALVHALVAVRERLSLTLGLAHLNHQLRDEADADESFCRELAQGLGLPFASARVDVRAEARKEGHSLEEQGRIARYRFLELAAAEGGFCYIATGHTQNDQAETFLLRLLRGAGSRGLSGIGPTRRLGALTVVRPLLDASRSDVLRFLAENRLEYREDATNADLSIDRNRVRHRAIPYFERDFNPRLVPGLARTADLLRDEDELLEQQAERVLDEIGRPASWGARETAGGTVALGLRDFGKLHPALKRRVARRALLSVGGSLRAVSARHVENVLQLASRGKSGRKLTIAAVEVTCAFDELRFERPTGLPSAFRHTLRVPGETFVPEASGTLEVQEILRPEVLPQASGRSVIAARPKSLNGPLDGPLTVRSPERGDFFQPLGAPGSKPLRRYLMEQRVDRERRKRVPVVAAGTTILWVVGHAVSERGRVGPGDDRVLRLGFRDGAR